MIAATGIPNSAAFWASIPPPGVGVPQRRRKPRQRSGLRGQENRFALDSPVATSFLRIIPQAGCSAREARSSRRRDRTGNPNGEVVYSPYLMGQRARQCLCLTPRSTISSRYHPTLRSQEAWSSARPFRKRSLHIKPQPLLGSYLFGPRLIDIGSDQLVQRFGDLLVLVGTTLGSFFGQVPFVYEIGE